MLVLMFTSINKVARVYHLNIGRANQGKVHLTLILRTAAPALARLDQIQVARNGDPGTQKPRDASNQNELQAFN